MSGQRSRRDDDSPCPARQRAVLALLLLLNAPAAFAADVVKKTTDEVKRYGRDLAAIARAPLTWDAAMWRRAGVVAAIDGAAFAADEDLARVAQRNRRDNVADFFTPFGGRRAQYIAVGVLLTGVATHHPALRESGRDAIEASILAGGIVTPIIKRAVGRSRPIAGEGAFAFDPLSANQSFPSGHATNAFAIASVFAAHSKGWVVPTIAYTLASGVAVARVNDNVHFTSDVIAGAAIGTAIGRSIVARHRAEETRGAKPRVSWMIVPMERGIGVELWIPLRPFRL